MVPSRLSWAVTAPSQDLLPWTVCSLSPNPCLVPCGFVVALTMEIGVYSFIP